MSNPNLALELACATNAVAIPVGIFVGTHIKYRIPHSKLSPNNEIRAIRTLYIEEAIFALAGVAIALITKEPALLAIATAGLASLAGSLLVSNNPTAGIGE
ncbi:MAG: hypothetical protein WCJ58_03330 [bacterium]